MDIIGLAKAADDPEPVGAPDAEAAGPKAKVHKGEDRAYIAGRKDPVYLNKYPKALLFLQRIRDEAHRFAITYHRLLMRKRDIQSVLDEIPGVGPVRKKALLAGFQDVDALRSASVEEIANVDGITIELAHAINDYLADDYPSGNDVA
jgi:excinuclease ABC subunit C